MFALDGANDRMKKNVKKKQTLSWFEWIYCQNQPDIETAANRIDSYFTFSQSNGEENAIEWSTTKIYTLIWTIEMYALQHLYEITVISHSFLQIDERIRIERYFRNKISSNLAFFPYDNNVRFVLFLPDERKMPRKRH